MRSAGGIVWRETAAGLRLALVHRRRRDDWSLPKGRVEAGERWQDGARREMAEETGCEIRLHGFAGAKLYVDRPEPKLVLYWHARVVSAGDLDDGGEIDEVDWLPRREALARLDHGSDRRLLLRALRTCAPQARGRGAGRWSTAALRDLIVVDSPPHAQDALPSVLATLSRLLVHEAPRAAGELA